MGIPKGVDKIHRWPYSNKITHFQTRDWKLSSLLVSWCCIWRWSFWICNNCKRSYFGKFTIIWSMILMWSSYCLTYSNQIYLVTFMQFFDTPGTPGGASIVERIFLSPISHFERVLRIIFYSPQSKNSISLEVGVKTKLFPDSAHGNFLCSG